MPRRAQNRVLRVRLIEQSPLGLQFLLSLLRKDSSIRIVGIQDLKGQDEKGTPLAPVIIVDSCGLPLPLSECLRELRATHVEAKYLILDHELPREEPCVCFGSKLTGSCPITTWRTLYCRPCTRSQRVAFGFPETFFGNTYSAARNFAAMILLA